MNPIYIPGPGDEVTWPAYYGHPNDPRYIDDWSHPPDRCCDCRYCEHYFSSDEILDELTAQAQELDMGY